MSILRGQFAMVMVVAAPDGTDAADLEGALLEQTVAFDLVVAVRALHDDVAMHDDVDEARCTVVVYGPDHPGIVHLVANELAARNVNIVDVTTRVSGTGGALYSMVMEVVLPPGLDVAGLEAELSAAAADDDLTVRVTPSDADVL